MYSTRKTRKIPPGNLNRLYTTTKQGTTVWLSLVSFSKAYYPKGSPKSRRFSFMGPRKIIRFCGEEEPQRRKRRLSNTGFKTIHGSVIKILRLFAFSLSGAPMPMPRRAQQPQYQRLPFPHWKLCRESDTFRRTGRSGLYRSRCPGCR